MTKLRILSRAQILGARDLEYREVETPEWRPEDWKEGDEEAGVRIHSLTRGDLHAVRRAASVPDGSGGTRLEDEKLEYLMFIAAVEADPPFTVEDIELLKDKSSGPFQRVITAIIEMSGLAPKAVKDAEKSVSS